MTHVKRKFGTHWAVILESVSGVRDNPEKPWKDAVRHEWRYPKDVFDLYTSAEVHTVKRRLPARLYVLAAMPLVFLLLVYLAYLRLRPEAQAEHVRKGIESQGGTVKGSAGSPGDGVMQLPNAFSRAAEPSNQAPQGPSAGPGGSNGG